MTIRDRGPARVLTATLAAVIALGLAGCNRDDPIPADGEFMGNSVPPAEGTGQEDGVVYEDPFDQEFIDEAATYVGQRVTISGEVGRTLSADTFTLSGAADPMLIVEEQEILEVSEGQSVEITGTVRENFSVAEVEEQLGIELDDELYTDFEGDYYVVATEGQAGDQE